jgi:hypothetical protein
MPAFENPEKRRLKGFLNINSNDSVGGWFSSRRDADETASSDRVACINLEEYQIEYSPNA